jgi:hypothetical protein
MIEKVPFYPDRSSPGFLAAAMNAGSRKGSRKKFLSSSADDDRDQMPSVLGIRRRFVSWQLRFHSRLPGDPAKAAKRS